MLLWFLRLFSAFRALESDNSALRSSLQEETTQKLILQDRIDAILSDRTKLWEMTQECIRGERTAYQAHINAQWQKAGHGRPYPEAPGLPEYAEPKRNTDPIVPRTMLPSEAVQAGTRKFIESYMEQLKNQ